MRPTGPADWLLSFVETRREMRPGLDVSGTQIVRHATAVSGDAHLVIAALRVLEERGAITRERYVPHTPDPVLPPGNTSIWHNTEHTGPAWKWIYRVASDWRERMGLPRSEYWCVEHNGVRYSGERHVPSFLRSSVWLYRFRTLLGRAA